MEWKGNVDGFESGDGNLSIGNYFMLCNGFYSLNGSHYV